MLATVSFVLAALSVVKAAPVPVVELATVEAALSLPNTTQHDQTAYYFYQQDTAGACGWVSSDESYTVGLPNEFYEDLASVSPYCGAFVVVEGNNKTVTALVADASSLNDTLTLSIGAWRSLNGDGGLKTVDWRFANETETAAAKAALAGSSSSVVATPAAATPAAPASSSVAPASSSSSVAPSSSSTQEAVAATSAVAEKKVASSSAAPAPSTTSTQAPKPSTTSTKEWKAETTTTTYQAPKTTTTTSVWKPTTTTTSKWVAPTTTTTQAPKTTQAVQQKVSSAASGSFSGRATYYFQGGAAGSCGNYASDSDYIVAVNAAQMNSGLCGKTVKITNTANGKTITARVADTCPGCGYGSLDLSEGAFGALGSYSSGVLPIAWDLY
ncbi:hypothetical protein JCM10450v2_001821 [Rhodotorula kratochvilovae]